MNHALYVYGFVKPKTGETLWYLIPRVNTAWLNVVYQKFAQDAGISNKKKVFLVEDNAGWHRSKKADATPRRRKAFILEWGDGTNEGTRTKQ